MCSVLRSLGVCPETAAIGAEAAVSGELFGEAIFDTEGDIEHLGQLAGDGGVNQLAGGLTHERLAGNYDELVHRSEPLAGHVQFRRAQAVGTTDGDRDRTLEILHEAALGIGCHLADGVAAFVDILTDRRRIVANGAASCEGNSRGGHREPQIPAKESPLLVPLRWKRIIGLLSIEE